MALGAVNSGSVKLMFSPCLFFSPGDNYQKLLSRFWRWAFSSCLSAIDHDRSRIQTPGPSSDTADITQVSQHNQRNCVGKHKEQHRKTPTYICVNQALKLKLQVIQLFNLIKILYHFKNQSALGKYWFI